MTGSPCIKRRRRPLVGLLALYHGGLLAYLLLRAVIVDGIWWLALLNTFALYGFLPLLISVPLALWRRARWALLLGAVPLLAALIGFGAPLLANTSPVTSPNGTPLDIITFNTWGWNGRFAQAVDWLAASGADVIVLQEIAVDGPDPRLDPLRTIYPHNARIDGSVRIFSRFPLLESEVVVTQPGLHGHLTLRTVLDVAGQPLTVYGVHFALPERETPHLPLPAALNRFPLSMITRYDETKRNGQMARLLARLADEPHPFIVAGDFNMSATSAQYGRFAEIMHDAYAQVGAGWGHTWPVQTPSGAPTGLPPLLRIDYIWHSHDLVPVSAALGPALGSDHLPLRAVMVIPRRFG